MYTRGSLFMRAKLAIQYSSIQQRLPGKKKGNGLPEKGKKFFVAICIPIEALSRGVGSVQQKRVS